MSIFLYLTGSLILIFSVVDGAVDISIGNAFNLDQDLSIHRQGKEDINFNASFRTAGLKSPQYYSIRFSKEILSKNFEFEIIHHKLYLDGSSPSEIQKFEVTDGYNLILVNFTNNIYNNLNYRIGLGTIVSHPDIIIEDKTNYVQGGGLIPKFWADGYNWDGISSQLSIFLNNRLNEKINYNLEGKLVMANTNIPVVDGNFDLPNLSFHLLLGISFLI